MPIEAFSTESCFNPQVIVAFDKMCRSLQLSRQARVTEAVVKVIIELARSGDR